MTVSRSSAKSWLDPPPDPGVPGAAVLLHPERVLGLLQPTFGATPLHDARIRYLEYAPGRSILAAVSVQAAGARRDVVLSRGRLQAPRRSSVEGVEDPVTSLSEHGDPPLVVSWYPCDPGLPLLADTDGMADLLGLPRTPPRRLAWVPQQRAVLQIGERIVKLHHTADDAERTFRTLRMVSPWVPAAEPVRLDAELGVVVQKAVVGRPLTRVDALDAAGGAARLLRTLHESPLSGGLVAHGPEHLLRSCRPVVELVCFMRPDLSDRVHRLVERLRMTAPTPGRLVPSHGDFNMGQLVRRPDRALVVVDTDTLCLAPAAWDLASYAANLVSGREGDLDAAQAAVRGLVGGYLGRPDGLEWYLCCSVLRRLDRAIRRAKSRWYSRTDRLLEDAEALAPR